MKATDLRESLKGMKPSDEWNRFSGLPGGKQFAEKYFRYFDGIRPIPMDLEQAKEWKNECEKLVDSVEASLRPSSTENGYELSAKRHSALVQALEDIPEEERPPNHCELIEHSKHWIALFEARTAFLRDNNLIENGRPREWAKLECLLASYHLLKTRRLKQGTTDTGAVPRLARSVWWRATGEDLKDISWSDHLRKSRREWGVNSVDGIVQAMALLHELPVNAALTVLDKRPEDGQVLLLLVPLPCEATSLGQQIPEGKGEKP